MSNRSSASRAEDLGLSEHAALLRSIARALVRDVASADDLVQEVALAALQAQKRGTRDPVLDPRSRHATVLRHRAHNAHRQDLCRRTREGAQASGGSLGRHDRKTAESDTQTRPAR